MNKIELNKEIITSGFDLATLIFVEKSRNSKFFGKVKDLQSLVFRSISECAVCEFFGLKFPIFGEDSPLILKGSKVIVRNCVNDRFVLVNKFFLKNRQGKVDVLLYGFFEGDFEEIDFKGLKVKLPVVGSSFVILGWLSLRDVEFFSENYLFRNRDGVVVGECLRFELSLLKDLELLGDCV